MNVDSGDLPIKYTKSVIVVINCMNKARGEMSTEQQKAETLKSLFHLSGSVGSNQCSIT